MKLNKILAILILITVLFVSVSAISAESVNDETVIAESVNLADDTILTDGDSSNYYVSNQGSDDNDGSQNSPFKTIGKAVEKTTSNVTTNIFLSEGTYQETGNVNLTVANNINLIGASAEKTILDGSNANWLANMNNATLNIKDLTIKNFFLRINETGTNAGIITSNSDVNVENVIISDNIIQTVLGAGEEKSTIYTGVLFSSGKITINNVTGFNNLINNTQGSSLAELRKLADWGCVICSFNSTTINDSYFYNNKGSRSSVVYAHTLTTLDIMNSKFENNTATYCGGVFLSYLNSTTHISNSFFKKNNGTNAGGIIYQQRYSNMYVDNCTFEDNYANTGGSLYAHHYSNLTATNTSFSTGRARTGSAIIGADFVVLTVTNCKFNKNNASEGAIMGDEGCQIIVDNCEFTNNFATFGAAVFGDMINDITVTNSTLKDNTATYGGAIFGTFETTIKIINNTFSGNKAVNGSVVFVDNTGKLDEEPETPAYYGITSSIYSKDNVFTNNTSEDGLMLVNYETENNPKSELEDTQIIISNVTTTVYIKSIDGDKKATVNITLKDNDGNVLSGKEINVVLDGVVYIEKTDENGMVILNLTISKVGTYDCVACFVGDLTHKSAIAVSQVVVTKKTAKLVLTKTTFKVKAKTKKYSVTLKDKNGKVLAKKQITVKIKNKTYKATTDSNGVAKVKVQLTKKGTYKPVVTFKGDSNYNKISKTGKIIVK